VSIPVQLPYQVGCTIKKRHDISYRLNDWTNNDKQLHHKVKYQKNYVFSWQGVRTPLTPLVWYDTRCYFNVRSKADISQLNLPHGTDNKKCVMCMATPLLCMRYNAVCTRPYCIDLMNMWAGLGYRRLILVLLQCVNRELEYSSTLISKNNATYLWNVVPLSGLRKISPRRVNRPLTVVCVVNLVRPATDFVSWSAEHLPWCTISSTWWSRRGASC